MADPIRSLSLFSGTGMLDAGAELCLSELGLDCLPLGYVEREAAAAYTLLVRMENQTLRPAPVWAADVADLDARPLRGLVDLLTASPPCQPYSSAGKRKGNDDERSHGDGDGPLAHVVRIFRECRPTLGFFENVPQWFTDGHFRRFGEELCGLGYDIAPPVFIASGDLGAPHRRERVFGLCWLADAARGGWRSWAERFGVRAAGGGLDDADRARSGRGAANGQAGARVRRGGSPDASGRLGHAEHDGRAARPAGSQQQSGAPERERVADSEGARHQGHEPARHTPAGRCAGELGGSVDDPAGARHEREGSGQPGEPGGRRCVPPVGCSDLPLVPPGRNDWRAWAAVASLDPTLMPAVEPGLPVVADALAPPASDLLRLGGNGVDPMVAAVALRILLADAGLEGGLLR